MRKDFKLSINSFFYYWGPLLTKTQVDDNIIKMLDEKGDELTIEEHDHSLYLAGEIEEEKKYPDDFAKEITSLLKPNIDNYFNLLKNQWSIKYKYLNFDYDIISMWINYQRRNESNPIHSHGGDISFVIYVDIPQDISLEKNISPKYKHAGDIIFDLTNPLFHVDDDEYRKALSPINQIIHEPKTGEMFIFPSTLRHYVLPFYSDVIRKSVSGNLTLRRQ